MMTPTSIPSDEEAVETWLRDYSDDLLSVGIDLHLSFAQQVELQDRLVSIQRALDGMIAIKRGILFDRAHSHAVKLPSPSENKYDLSAHRFVA